MRTNRRALIIGIQDYKTIGKLDYARNDAELTEQMLREYQCQFSCTLLLDDEATMQNISMNFKKMLIESDDDAVLIFYYAGHAVTIDNGTFLVTLDSEANPEFGVHLTRLVEIIKANRKSKQNCVFLLDCCHAGAFSLENLHISIDSITETLTSSMGIFLIAATEASSKAKESKKLQQGIFTHWLFNGLVGGAADHEGKVTVFTLYEYIAQGLSEYHSYQKPVFKSNIVGNSAILGDGFEPRPNVNVSKLNSSQLSEIKIKIKNCIDSINLNINVDQKIWEKRIFKEVSIVLSDLIEWRTELKNKHAELKDNKMFRQYDHEIMHLQAKMSNINDNTIIPTGVIANQIGMGGFGTVFKVKAEDKNYAYKVYHANQLHDRLKLKAFRRGYRAMKKLDHPNIVKVHEKTFAPEGFFMEYINGPNFRDCWIEDLTQMLNILHIIAQTIGYAHTKGVVHRDIKPENIIICQNSSNVPIPYLTDFDLAWYSMATVYSSIISKGTVAAFGHYLYAAPEQYEQPERDITRRQTTDIYGFGQLCYFAICNSDPPRDASISKESLKERIKKWHSAQAAKNFFSMYEKCIERTPTKRFSSMEEVSYKLIEIRNLLIDPDRDKEISIDEFIEELLFSLFGFEKEITSNFYSRSGRTQIEIEDISNKRIMLKFNVSQGFTNIGGKFIQQRKSINRRIDLKLNSLNNNSNNKSITRCSVDFADVFCTRIEINKNCLTLHGVGECREVIDAIIQSIES